MVAREVVIALPHELSERGREMLTRNFASDLSKRYGVAVQFAIHRPSKVGDNRNHHAHVMFTTRRVELANGELRFGAKTRQLDVKETSRIEVAALREGWAEMQNAALVRAGSKETVSAKSHRARGIARMPTKHLGPARAAMERKRLQATARQPLEARRLAEAPEIGRTASTGLPEAPATPKKPIGEIGAGPRPSSITSATRKRLTPSPGSPSRTRTAPRPGASATAERRSRAIASRPGGGPWPSRLARSSPRGSRTDAGIPRERGQPQPPARVVV